MDLLEFHEATKFRKHTARRAGHSPSEFLNYNRIRCCNSDAALRIVTHLPLREQPPPIWLIQFVVRGCRRFPLLD
jgi:hypothetical protein